MIIDPIELAAAILACVAVGYIGGTAVRAWLHRDQHEHRYNCRPFFYEEGYGAMCICDICGKEEVLT